MVLKTKVVQGEGFGKLNKLSHEVMECTPGYVLSGLTVLSAEETPEQPWRACLWGEDAFWAEGSIKELVDNFECHEKLTGEESRNVYLDAMVQALSICTGRKNVKDFGAVLLDKHPECRALGSEGEAVIGAALAERKATFEPEDYE